MIEIIPAILAETSERFNALISKISALVPRASIDIIDGEFVQTKTVSGYSELSAQPLPLRFDVHLMVKDPIDWMRQPWPQNADRFFGHIEALGNRANEFVGLVHSLGKKAGLVMNPETAIEAVEPHVSDLDAVQFMTVHPGAYGSKFLSEALKKVSTFHKKYPKMPIAVDGGITPEIAPLAVASGANILVVGGYVMMSEDPASSLRKIQNAVLLS